ncbi:hypothetical protein B0J17DRAFT_660006 [Rhizoctonia solani]|nr:hypothetical protein B0J17DRAFT_660006 [Rhizoctonia solani]
MKTNLSLPVQSTSLILHFPFVEPPSSKSWVRFGSFDSTTSSLTWTAYPLSLVELRIQEVAFGQDNTLMEFLLTLSSAPRLPILDIISVTAQQEGDLPASTNKTLFCNVLYTVLQAIKPGGQRVVLSLTHLAPSTLTSTGYVGKDFDALMTAIRPHHIDILALNVIGAFDAPDHLHSLLSIMPSLTTIYLNRKYLDRALIVLTGSRT